MRYPTVHVNRHSRVAASCLLAVFVPAIIAAQSAPAPQAAAIERTPVLVELFTSEGCPHCPEADALLERLYTTQPVNGTEIIALEEHVDYWDRPDWTDHYSSPFFTERQKAYADAMDLDSLYTPQMVVDGLMEFVGVSESRARTAINTLSHAPKGTVHLTPQPIERGKPGPFKVEVSLDLPAGHAAADVFLVVAEDKLYSRVDGGSNKGERWPHSSIARHFEHVGAVPASQQHFGGTIELKLPDDPQKWQNLRVIVIAQATEDRPVLALRSLRLADFLPQLRGETQPTATAAPKAGPGSSKTTGP